MDNNIRVENRKSLFRCLSRSTRHRRTKRTDTAEKQDIRAKIKDKIVRQTVTMLHADISLTPNTSAEVPPSSWVMDHLRKLKSCQPKILFKAPHLMESSKLNCLRCCWSRRMLKRAWFALIFWLVKHVHVSRWTLPSSILITFIKKVGVHIHLAWQQNAMDWTVIGWLLVISS